MSKIFRLHKDGTDGVIDWQSSTQHIGETLVNTIEDPAGENAQKQITSVPSPFARMDLVRTAFRYITSKKQLDGNTIYHRIVSEVFDIAEIFFNAESLKNKIEIIPWDAGIISITANDIAIKDESDLGRILKSKNKKHKLFGETLKMFLHQDRDAYNFALLQQIFLINYKKGPELTNIIGGTSPATLFFSSANEDIRDYLKNIQFGDHKVFDIDYCPLLKRNDDFKKYIYALRKNILKFSELFKDIDDYLNLTLKHKDFPNEVKDEIREFTPSTYNSNYVAITVGSNAGFVVEIIGNPLRGYNQGIIVSDFEIGCSKNRDIQSKPLVLPNETFNEALKYVNGTWKPEYRAPYFDGRPLDERTLPNQEHIKMPYLTISDFLEPYIMRIPYPMNKEKYFNGNFNEMNYGYILPIKKELFKYFSIKDVLGTVPDGKKFFELIKQAGESVEAVLRIPIKNGKYIKFSRLYSLNQFQDHLQTPNETENKGIIAENQFGITVYPFLKTGDDSAANYRVLLIDRDVSQLTKSNEYQLAFYKETEVGTKIKTVDKKTRSDKNTQPISSVYFVVDKEFDIIEIKPNSAVGGVLIPHFKLISEGGSEFTFAVDFGTTNTHIEYKIDRGNEQPFEITDSDFQLGSLHYNNRETDILLRDIKLGFGAQFITELIPKEFLPDRIGRNFEHKFPIRTLIAENRPLNFRLATYTLADFNIPFVYEKTDLPNNVFPTTNLKWANFRNSEDNTRRVEAFIEKLLILIRNKVLLNSGRLEATKIVWFYPSSMSEHRRNTLEEAWNKYTKKYISNAVTPSKLSESIAPFFYLNKRGGIQATHMPVASIDIGGGTTDIVIYTNNTPVILTSFKFAASSLFGDGYGSSPSDNGFVNKYYAIIKDKLLSAELYELDKAMEQIKSKESSQELITFFFSLESNKNIKDGNFPISFSQMLKNDEDYKIVFLFFYAAIIYHLASLMKAKKLGFPRYITFSGTASKLLNIADPGIGLKNLTEYTKIIFSEVYSGSNINNERAGHNMTIINKSDTELNVETTAYDGQGKPNSTLPKPNIELKQYEDPKELTCKGGLHCTNFASIDEIKTVLVGGKIIKIIPESSLKYNELDDMNLLHDVEVDVINFIDMFFSWNEKYNYHNKFGVNPSFERYKEDLKADLMQHLIAGIREKQAEVQENINIQLEETLFFYALIGSLNKLGQNIYSNLVA